MTGISILSIESLLAETTKRLLSPEELGEVRRILYGKQVSPLQIPESVHQIAESANFTVESYSFDALSEIFRDPRFVRIGLVQHKMPLSPSSPFQDQLDAVHSKISVITKAASIAGVNILCYQVRFVYRLVCMPCFCDYIDAKS